MIEIDKLEALAKAAGGDEWTATDRIVWFGDGDSAMQVMNPVPAFIAHDNLGAWPDAIVAEDVAQFAAAMNPAAILALIAEVRALREDKARLDYLEAHKTKDDRDGGWSGYYVSHVPAYSASTWGGAIPFSHDTLRQAIDAARGAA
ncbi:MAG: hypothetical protein CPSOU_1808 [uncultured Paraburkholderia sp.]|nr:MAG: hypothetical protein CPSOU_1808 [uncultured Paraburkholderia sp.]